MTNTAKKLVIKLRKELTENILDRYDSAEYWEVQIVDDFCQDYKINREKIYKILGI